MRPSPLVHPIELGRGEASSGAMDSMSPMPRGLPDPGPRDYLRQPAPLFTYSLGDDDAWLVKAKIEMMEAKDSLDSYSVYGRYPADDGGRCWEPAARPSRRVARSPVSRLVSLSRV